MELPDCPHCNNMSTLTPARAEPRGVKVCVCSWCGKTCRINAAGAVIHVDTGVPIPSDPDHDGSARHA